MADTRFYPLTISEIKPETDMQFVSRFRFHPN